MHSTFPGSVLSPLQKPENKDAITGEHSLAVHARWLIESVINNNFTILPNNAETAPAATTPALERCHYQVAFLFPKGIDAFDPELASKNFDMKFTRHDLSDHYHLCELFLTGTSNSHESFVVKLHCLKQKKFGFLPISKHHVSIYYRDSSAGSHQYEADYTWLPNPIVAPFIKLLTILEKR